MTTMLLTPTPAPLAPAADQRHAEASRAEELVTREAAARAAKVAAYMARRNRR